ncbi:e3 ubiquitin-protein ligase siah2 [Holotrichia oblita]|uniref:E3 ubiquitin-protein ligase siah2 n=1 Tax=Holotrichia oblita TaxID=644536 RepID=A0ACB9SWT4_HOLOL|nr:e3 ubiquitin-protein ligase siah2 [Holotrichia oblita]
MIPRHVIDGLKCGLCNSGLSIFPIHSYGNNDMVTCGRCPVQGDFLPQREHLYEELAKYIEFSCRYENLGCIEKLKPDELQKHESVCPQKPCLCPILPLGECKWQGNYQDLREHCSDTHPTHTFGTLELEINIVTAHEENYVFHQADQTFVAQLKCDTEKSKFHCNVICSEIEPKSKKFSYSTRFTDKKSDDYVCEKYAVQFCNVSEFVINENTSSVNINDIIINLNEPTCVIFKIDIKVETTAPPKKKIFSVDDDNEMLKAIECPVCFEYMVPPIVQCNAGHSFCGSHKDQLTTCPAGCQNSIGETRNYLLEQITNIIEYPCKYNKHGCSYSSNAKQIRDHENSCVCGPYKCIVDSCDWVRKFADLRDHLLDEHKDNIIELNCITYIMDEEELEESESYIFITEDNIFKLSFTKDNDKFFWVLQIVGIDLLRKLECPVCLEYMIPPIMQCNGGHSFCQTCRNQITTCPICKGTISDTRNFLLEDITSMIVYPCKYKKYGCKFSTKADQIQQHQNTCINGPYRCIMDDCGWLDRHAKFLDHLSDTHKDNIVETDSVSYILDNTLDMEFYNYICIVNGKVFRIEFSRDGDEFWWFIHTTTDNTDADKYMLILDFKSESDERLYIKKKTSEHSVLFQKDQLCNCTWQGDCEDLFAHCVEKHPHFVQESFSIEINLVVSSHEENYVFYKDGKTFLAQLKSDIINHRLYINVMYCGPNSTTGNLSYRVSFLGNEREYPCSVYPVQLDKTGPITAETVTTVDFLDILETLNRPVRIMCKIDTFVQEVIEKPEEDEVLSQGNGILQQLECPICLEYMTPPILQCHGGHSFCQPCRKKITTCPTCRSAIGNTRNFLLENITSTIPYPCKYKKYGCNFSTSANNIQKHQAACIKVPCRCIMNDCSWEDRHSKLVAHLTKTHKDNFLETDSVSYILDDSLDVESYNYICIVNDHVFRIEFTRDRDSFWWIVYTKNDIEDVKKYMLKLDFKAENNERIYIERTAVNELRSFYKHQLSEFINGGVLTYKMHIVERR